MKTRLGTTLIVIRCHFSSPLVLDSYSDYLKKEGLTDSVLLHFLYLSEKHLFCERCLTISMSPNLSTFFSPNFGSLGGPNWETLTASLDLRGVYAEGSQLPKHEDFLVPWVPFTFHQRPNCMACLPALGVCPPAGKSTREWHSWPRSRGEPPYVHCYAGSVGKNF